MKQSQSPHESRDRTIQARPLARAARLKFGRTKGHCRRKSTPGRYFQVALTAVRAGDANLSAIRDAVTAELGLKGKRFFRPLRLAMTGAGEGPELGPLFELLSAEMVESRLERWVGAE